MSDFEIKVVGTKPRRKPAGRLRRGIGTLGRTTRAVLRRPRLLGLICAVMFVLLRGTPHVGGAYECNHPMHGPGTCHSVAWCAYYGIQGRRIEIPERGESCKLFTVLPVQWSKLIGGNG